LFYGTLEYAARTLILHNKPEDIEVNITQLMNVLRPHLSGETTAQTGTDNAVLKRLERAVRKLERLR